MFQRLPKIFRNFYFTTGLLFLLWLLFLDSNSLIARFQFGSKLNTLEKEKKYYNEKIIEVQKDHDELFGDKESIEKFAREKYLMKKSSEDIYVIEEK
jgi:cell division protein DivIC